jgi:uncharacterized membrane protein HdeD (DUF308 family)
MVDLLARNWPWMALRGVAAVVFGLVLLLRPADSVEALVLVFGAFAFLTGLFTVVSAVVNRQTEPYWVSLLVSGMASVAIGVVTYLMPAVTARTLLYLVAIWAAVVGVAEILAAVRLRREITGEWFLVAAGVLSVVFGVLLVLFPGAGALALVMWIGAYALVAGVVMFAFALRLRRWGAGVG